MLKNENIICISSIDWDFNWQGHQEIMHTLAANGNRVLFIENTGVRRPRMKDIQRLKKRFRDWRHGIKGIRQQEENLFIYSPVILPLPYSRTARWVNRRLILPALRRWIDAMDFNNPIIWTFLPTGIALDIMRSLDSKYSVYYCIANFAKLSDNPTALAKAEPLVIKSADAVFAQDKFLADHCRRYNENVHIFPFGVGTEFFAREKDSRGQREKPADLENIAYPIVGYVGGIHRWVDMELVRFIAGSHPECSFVFIGPVQEDISGLRGIKNLHFLGQKSYKDLPAYIRHFQMGIIPYRIAEYTNNVYPTKLNEYLAMGKPVISTALPAVKDFNRANSGAVKIAATDIEFRDLISGILAGADATTSADKVRIARQNLWSSRIEQMCDVIERGIEDKARLRNRRWADIFKGFYYAYRRRAFQAALGIALAWCLLFYTPFIWFVASPLRISQAPQKADAIVVFGGGVGEIGRPGGSTLERARYSAELFRKAFAGKVIYSSGYTYNYNDAENMRLMALSMGVPDRDIILEKKANSTYENVIFSKEILDKHNCRSILLVSSPYNMRRAEMVFKKFAGNIKVFYTPVPKSQFYDRVYGSRLEQINAILHEYLGIAYYLLRGHA